MTKPVPGLNRDLTSDGFVSDAKRRERQLMFWATVLSFGLGLAYTVRDSPLLPLVLLVVLAIPAIIWRWPNVIIYVTFASACLFELFFSKMPDALTDFVPIFWNLNTIIQVYGHTDFKGVPLNLLEVLFLFGGLCGFLRSALLREGIPGGRLLGGPLFGPLLGYIVFVAWAFLNGVAQGGDFKIALQESRAQIYIFIAYLMSVNLTGGINEARRWLTVHSLWWTMIVCISLKGLLYTFRRYITLAGKITDQGVGSHEEAFFFTTFVLLLLSFLLVNAPEHRRFRTVMLCLLPMVILGNLATNRRAGTAALVISAPLLLMGAYRALPERRRQIVGGVAVVIPLCVVYYLVFQNSSGAIGQPARALHSQFNPDPRDADSNAYREAENKDQLATIRSSPIIGYGYGRRMFHAVPIADISLLYDWWDVLPHNQILWVWMRVGTIGYTAFWIFACAVILRCSRNLRDAEAGVDSQVLSLFCLSAFVSLLIFGLLDLQLSNFRDMLFTGFWLGCLPSSHNSEDRLAVGEKEGKS